MTTATCNFCKTPLRHSFVDLGMCPLANAYLSEEDLRSMEPFYPHRVYVCDQCFLVQLPESQTSEHLFENYSYFSSYSDHWRDHCRRYAEAVISRFGIGAENLVVEIASNDGCLLRCFKQRGVPVLGIEPAKNVAKVAEASGIPTLTSFFGVATARQLLEQGRQADLLVGQNVLAHVPDLNDFVQGLAIVLRPQGVLTVEFPHLLRMMQETQFDQVYHEHFSYLSLTTAEKIFNEHGMSVFDVEQVPTHGGSLRLYVRHLADRSKPTTGAVAQLAAEEQAAGLTDLAAYLDFADSARAAKRDILRFLIEAKDAGKSLVGYGAPAKGNVLLNYCGIGRDFLDYTVDRSPHKQGQYLPGSHIPIHHPDKIRETQPDYVVILPWNLKNEIMQQMADIADWGGQFVVLVPEVKIFKLEALVT